MNTCTLPHRKLVVETALDVGAPMPVEGFRMVREDHAEAAGVTGPVMVCPACNYHKWCPFESDDPLALVSREGER